MTELIRPASAFALRRRPDDEVFSRAFRGDDLAFAEIYHRYYARVFGFCLSRTVSPDLAHDAAQETFTRLLSADADRVSNPVAWIYAVARNVCVDVCRRQHRTTPLDDSEAGADAAASTDETAEDKALRHQDAASVFLALRRLRPRYRNALVLREIHHQPMDEIAATLGVREPTAYTVLSRARDAFGHAYAQVLELPKPCRIAVERIYRQTGTGLNSSESAALETHLDGCPRCRKERDRASDTGRMPSLLPLIAGNISGGLITRAARLLGQSAPALDSASHAGVAIAPSLAKVLPAAALSLALVAGGTVTSQHVAARAGSRRRTSHVASQPPSHRTASTPAAAEGAPPACESRASMARIGRQSEGPTSNSATDGVRHAGSGGQMRETSGTGKTSAATRENAPKKRSSAADQGATSGSGGGSGDGSSGSTTRIGSAGATSSREAVAACEGTGTQRGRQSAGSASE